MSFKSSQTQHNSTLSIYNVPTLAFRANKIICTIGPKTQTIEALKTLMTEGMNVARMNFSHGDYEFHGITARNVKLAAKELGVFCGLALDTKGPEIRTGMVPGGEVFLPKDHKVRVSTDEAFKLTGTKDCFYIDYPRILAVMNPGDRIFIDDGLLGLEVVTVGPTYLDCIVVCPANISSKKGCNLPGKDVDLPAVSEKDKADLAWGAEQDVDMIFASFIRSAEQVHDVRKALGPTKQGILVISKIENHQGVEKLDEILAASDGCMVARGDLGVEIAAEKVFIAQKMMIARCNIAGKPVICATQMLESMTHNPRPTRAEVSDVANAVLDGADCVMLSGETAKGQYFKEVVNVMARICIEAQAASRDGVMFTSIKQLQPIPMHTEESVSSSAVNSAFELNAKAIFVLSNTGKTTRLVAKYHPHCPIIAISSSEEVCRHMSLVRAVFPVHYNIEVMGSDDDKEKRVQALSDAGKALGFVGKGDVVVVVHADMKTKGFANQTRVLRIE